MQVFVLLDRQATVFAVTTDSAAADAWVALGGDFGSVEVELDDFTVYNEVMDELAE